MQVELSDAERKLIRRALWVYSNYARGRANAIAQGERRPNGRDYTVDDFNAAQDDARAADTLGAAIHEHR